LDLRGHEKFKKLKRITFKEYKRSVNSYLKNLIAIEINFSYPKVNTINILYNTLMRVYLRKF